MHAALLATMILAATTGVEEGRRPGVGVFFCPFDMKWDVNHDNSPDGWHRETGRGFPRYVEIVIEDDDSAVAGRCLNVHLNGGGAAIRSPAIPVSSLYSYRLDARLRTTGLTEDRASISIEFLDDDGKRIQAASSPPTRDASEWTEVTIGPIALDSSEISRAVIRLGVLPGKKPDLKGTVSFDNIRLVRLPRVIIRTNSRDNVYTRPNDVIVKCDISGIHEQHPTIHFELLDPWGKRLNPNEEPKRLKVKLIVEDTFPQDEPLGVEADLPDGFQGSETWQPPISDYGYYRIRVTVEGANRKLEERHIAVAIINKRLPRSMHGEFGWSLTSVEEPLSMDELTRLLPRVGIHWVKVPVWYREGDDAFGDRVLRFTEHLTTSGIELVGVLDRPPAGTDLANGLDPSPDISDVLSLSPTVWATMLEPVMTRLSLRVRWWQLGSDHDTSFVGYPSVDEKITEIRQQLYRFGQNVNLGIAWQWIEEASLDRSAPWEFLQFSAEPSLTGNELGAYLETTRNAAASRWALIEPLPYDRYRLNTRTRDLVDQMLAAKTHQADAAFVSAPFHDEHGLMKENGTPGELFLPWRTTATLLGGSTHIGKLELPNGSENAVFRHEDGTLIMVARNNRPVQETLYLGEHIRRIDIWGRETVAKKEGHRQVLEIDAEPTFFVGLNEPVARWRMAVRFEHDAMRSVFGRPHQNSLQISNAFIQGGNGRATLSTDTSWRVSPEEIRFPAVPGESLHLPFDVVLLNASSGRRKVRIDFDLRMDKRYQFSVYRHLDVGLGDVELEASTHLDEDGLLVVEQRMINRSDRPADFRCFLAPPGQRPQRKYVFRLGPIQDIQQYRLRDSDNLAGEELVLRAEELGGDRVFVHRFRVEK